MGLTVLFTHLKIILLQYFQFSVFRFSNNKFNLNGPTVYHVNSYNKNCTFFCDIKIFVLVISGLVRNLLIYYQ